MSGSANAVTAYVLALILILGYAAILWRASRRLDRRDHQHDQTRR
jgi:hypothetical protein